MKKPPVCFGTLIAISTLFVSLPGISQEKERPKVLKNLFGSSKTEQRTDRKADTIAHLVKQAEDDGASAARENDSFDRYPHLKDYKAKHSKTQKEIETLIDSIYSSYEARIDRMDPPDLNASALAKIGKIPTTFDSAWRSGVGSSVWGSRTTKQSMDDVYMKTLAYSNQVKVFSDIPLIRETGMQEAEGEFDITGFADGRIIRRDEPIGSELTTGGSGRFLEDEKYFEAGVRKKFYTGTEATLSNRWSTLNNNSQFLTPNNQGASELVLSVVHPLLEGRGYHYNQATIKIARLDAHMASSEFVRQLQSHLLEVNRAYWSLYFARASYLLKQRLVNNTTVILKQLESRSDLDALQSEILRARSAVANQKASLNRAEMAIRNSEERLRAMINDPDFDIGSNAETIPLTRPVFSRYSESVKSVAKNALHNRPEIQQGFDQLRAAVIRRDMQLNEKKPALNLIAEAMLGDIRENDDYSGAFQDQWNHGPGYVVGLSFEQPWDNDFARARAFRREVELRQQANQLKTTIDTVLLEAVVSYRELMTAFRDMQGKYESLTASREELRQLKERLEVDTDEEQGGRTMAYQLQLILDSIERLQASEESFLDSVVAYNASFAGLERAKGTFLRYQDIEIKRVDDSDPTHPNESLEMIRLSKGGGPAINGGKNGYGGGKGNYGGKDNYAAASAVAKPQPTVVAEAKPKTAAPAPPKPTKIAAVPADVDPPTASPAIVPPTKPTAPVANPQARKLTDITPPKPKKLLRPKAKKADTLPEPLIAKPVSEAPKEPVKKRGLFQRRNSSTMKSAR